MNEDLYDTGSAVVGLYRLITGWIHWGGGGELYLKLGEIFFDNFECS